LGERTQIHNLEKMRKITIYKDMNEPYLSALKQGLADTPEERFIRFFEEKAKFQRFMGINHEIKRQIIIKKVTWI
jgi:hypothetical protein